MYLAYTYYVRNKITNEFYYGSRYQNVKLERTATDDFWVYYFTSSKKIAQLIDIYGKNSFIFEIIEEYYDYDVCYKEEQKLIEQHINNPLCLNKHYTREGKVKFLRAGTILSNITRNKMSDAKKNILHTQMHNKKVSDALRIRYNTPVVIKQNKRNRRAATQETKDKMSVANLERIKKTCPFCSKQADPGNYSRYHGNKCKFKT